jgi:alkanesulfonate monooxygenase SsuD/methylene tetrahydromethanopterin reductase-like flavin-dependent oxidoreductase (luciferase family)
LKSHWDNYSQGKKNVGAIADIADWRVARSIFVADDKTTAERYGGSDLDSPYRFYYSQLYAKLQKSGRHTVFKSSLDQPDSEVTIEYILSQLNITGTVPEVVDKILALRDEIGDFGELVYANMDWVDESLARRSMQLLAEEVMPRVRAQLR